MDTDTADHQVLVNEIATAARLAFQELQHQHREKFYYFTLMTTGEAHAPWPSAWSREALSRLVEASEDPNQEQQDREWCYASSPYCGFGENHFEIVNKLFDQRSGIDVLAEEDWDREYDFRLSAMEEAMKRLDGEGIFGTGSDRLETVILVEVMPPDDTNAERAQRLNPTKALEKWPFEVGDF